MSDQSAFATCKALSYLEVKHHACSNKAFSKERDQSDGTCRGSENIRMDPTIRSVTLKNSSTPSLEQID